MTAAFVDGERLKVAHRSISIQLGCHDRSGTSRKCFLWWRVDDSSEDK